ncbi:MAG: CDP-diacylglycerol--glycerol-3-phosphate 3-phosphatidyltransferase [Alphaproteobacteria bacterium]
MFSRQSIPNLLSVLRALLVIPAISVWWLLPASLSYPFLLGLFALAAASDFVDGYLARKWQVQSPFGAMIDQITDKLVVATFLVILLADHALWWLPALIIILREIYVSGLREYLALAQIPMPVSGLGKWKTATQMLAILALLGTVVFAAPLLALVGNLLLSIAALLALISAMQYSRALRR